jgi:shikimate dehydrogenase
VGARALGVCGFNVTIPHKETIMKYLDEVTEEGRAIGAVNTVYLRAGRLVGHNTDGAGFLQPLQTLPVPFSIMPSLILGAGGAARAIAMALLQSGCPRLTIANRTYARAERLILDLQAYFPQVPLQAVTFARAVQEASGHTLIVNATSVGLHEGGDELLPAQCFRPEHIVYDIVYRPLYTPFLQTAQRCGATIVTGIDMLIGQGAVAFQLWTGQPFPTEAVRQALQPFLILS